MLYGTSPKKREREREGEREREREEFEMGFLSKDTETKNERTCHGGKSRDILGTNTILHMKE